MENLTNISTVKDILRKYGFKFSKSLGQNFLINPSVCPRIAEIGGAKKGAGIIEVGTGIGVLTAELAKRADKVVAVEIDSSLLPVLDETLGEYDNIRIINDDILKVDLRNLIENEFDAMPVSVCANLPYYITSPVIMRLLESELPIEAVTVMVQREAAERICALPGTRGAGAISLAVRYYSDPEILFKVPKGSFIPAPKVDSAVIRLQIKKAPPANVKNKEYYFSLVRAAFSQRRKILVNPVSSAFNISKADLKEMLIHCDISTSARAEQLYMEQFIRLSNMIHEHLQA